MEVTYQKKRKFISTGIRIFSDQWGKDSKIKNHPQALLFNQQISDMVAGIYDYAHKLQSENVPFSFEKLDEHLNGVDPRSSQSFLMYMRKRIEERNVSEVTKKRHRCILKALKEFGEIQSFADISFIKIKHWDEFAHKKCALQSSVYNYHKVLKIFVREAFAEQLIPTDPYMTIKLDRGQTSQRKFLTKEELELIEDANIPDKYLGNVRDTFLFCCYTGLAYADVSKFDFSEAVLSDGLYRIRDCRQKTGTEYNISLIDKAMAILRKYSFKLPIISNQKYNSYLKILGAFCGVKKRITSHVARHTFATTITMANGVRIEVISKMLGHTNIKTTQIYAKVCQPEVDSEFNRLNQII
jgi:site-specific recombinase XerD